MGWGLCRRGFWGRNGVCVVVGLVVSFVGLEIGF